MKKIMNTVLKVIIFLLDGRRLPVHYIGGVHDVKIGELIADYRKSDGFVKGCMVY